jgi:hypothetical protein
MGLENLVQTSRRKLMRAFPIFVLMIVTGAVLLSPADHSKAAPPTRDTPATSTIADFDPTTGVLFSIGSDSLGSYRNGVDSVSSIVQGIGNWVLDTKPSPVRKVMIDLRDAVPNTGSNPPFQTAIVPTRFISKCTTSINTLAVNQSILCPIAISINYLGTTYAIRGAEPTAPDTDPVIWTCLARNSSQCVSWRMRPSAVQADGQTKNVLTLLKVATRPKDPDVPIGKFYMSFDINVTTP